MQHAALVRRRHGVGDLTTDVDRVVGVLAVALVGADEEDVPARSDVETFTAVKVEIENWRWAGVPFYLRTGKHLPRRATEIAIQFNRPPLTLFKDSASDPEPNMLAMRIQPDEGILLRFAAKVPDLGLDVRSVNMDFSPS